ncbi:TPA: hypothetical protein VDU83_002512 [Pseudomonas aeruginosa]|nr:hypothetical protein [Pseudomonas aeruginosa]
MAETFDPLCDSTTISPQKAVEPYDLSQFKPFETIVIGQSPGVCVTAESLARFKVMEGLEDHPAGSCALMVLAEAKVSSPE